MSEGRAAWALVVLFLLNTLNFFDRNVFGAVVEPVRREFGLSDAEIGWIGTAFILLYALVGLPLGRLADAWRRRMLLCVGGLLWSALTALSGLATGFATLFAARLGVGVGEAVCAPASASLIGDLFPSSRRARATSVFMLGLPVGISLSFALGGAVAQAWGWRATFFLAGLPGLVIALLCLTLPEPVRGASEASRVGSRRRSGSFWRVLLGTSTLRFIILSGALHNFNMYALATFLPALLVRHHGMSVRGAGLVSALLGVMGGLGMILGGQLGDRLSRRGPSGRLALSAAALAVTVPAMLALLAQPPGAIVPVIVAVGALALPLYMYYAPVYASIQDVVEPSLRGTAMAVYFLAMYLLGASVGPVGTGWLSDWLSRRAAEAAGAPAVTESFRAVGLHQAMYVIPALSVPLVLALALAARRAGRDHDRIRAWMEEAAAS